MRTKDSEIKVFTLCLGIISKDFTINNMKKKTGLIKRKCKIFFLANFSPTDTNDVLDIHR